MQVENELAEIVTNGDYEFEKTVKEYEEDVLVQEEVPEPPLTDSVDTTPAQGKPQCITSIFHIHRVCIYIYMCVCVVHLCCRNSMETTCIYISTL